MSAPAPAVAPAPPVTVADEDAAERQRLAALAARRTQADERPSWFSPAPPGPSGDELARAEAAALAEQRAQQAFYEEWQRQLERERQLEVEQAAAARAAEQAAQAAEQAAATQAALQAAAAAEHAVRRFHDGAGATVVHPDALRGALMATPPPAAVEPPQAQPQPQTPQPGQPQPVAAFGAPEVTAPPAPAGMVSQHAPESLSRGRKPRTRRPSRKPDPAAPSPEQVAAIEAQLAAEAEAQEAAVEAYRRFAREGTMVVEDYYHGPEEQRSEAAEPVVVIADSLIPTGKPRLAPRPDKPRGPKIVAALVVVALGGGAYLFQTHQVTPPAPTGLPAVTLDQTTATTGASFTVPAASTAGPAYRLTVPAGWRAASQPTRPGGEHTDVTVTEPILGLTVTVRSVAASAPSTVTGTPVDTALRVFGHPAGIVAPATAAGSASVSRVATVTQRGIRYSVTLTVPRESATRDYGRADTVARSLTDTP